MTNCQQDVTVQERQMIVGVTYMSATSNLCQLNGWTHKGSAMDGSIKDLQYTLPLKVHFVATASKLAVNACVTRDDSRSKHGIQANKHKSGKMAVKPDHRSTQTSALRRAEHPNIIHWL
jgi:hypothetical protein